MVMDPRLAFTDAERLMKVGREVRERAKPRADNVIPFPVKRLKLQRP